MLLDISNVNEGSISKLGNLIGLTQLDLLGVPYRNKVTDVNRKPLKFDGFETLVNLEFLMFKGFNIDDVSILANLPKLIYIDFSQSVVNDYTPLLKNKSLSSIVVPFEWDMSGKDKDLYELFETHNISIGTLEYFR